MDVVDESSNVVDGRPRRQTVPDVEDVPGPTRGALEHVVDPHGELPPGREKRCRVEVPLYRAVEADPAPGLVERQRPVETDDVASARDRVLQIRAHPEGEVDH